MAEQKKQKFISKNRDGEKLRAMLKSVSRLEGEREFIFPDSFACEHYFLSGFINERMGMDFSCIARDFFANEAERILSYRYVDYIDAGPGEFGPVLSYERWFLNMMYCAYKQGSTYAKDLFLYLYKTYYRKEFSQLKRFKRLTDKEVLSLAGDDPEHVSRILCMARIMNITLDATAAVFFPWMTSLFQEQTLQRLERPVEFTAEEYSEAIDEACSVFLAAPDILEVRETYLGFVNRAYAGHLYENYPVYLEEDAQKEALEDLARTILILKKQGGDRIFSAEEMAVFSVLYHSVKNSVKASNFTRMYLEKMAGTRDLGEYLKEPCLFCPEQVGSVVTNLQVEKEDVQSQETDRNEEVFDEAVELLQKEIESLRFKLHAGETEVKRLNTLVREQAKEKADLQGILSRYEDEHKELYSLREYVYGITEQDLPEQEAVDHDAMAREIAEHAIVIIGGNQNWTKKLMQLFPGWVYLSASAVKTESFRVLEKAERVYFFTETLGHSQYNRYIREVREKGIPFSYIHGVNLKTNIAQIHKDLQGGKMT